MSTTDIPLTACPYCLKELDRATGGSERQPVPGSLSVCAECFKVSEFDENLRMQKFDINQLMPADRQKMEALIRSTRAVVNNWTFIHLREVKQLPQAINFATPYAPAVIFTEDIDQVLADPDHRDEEANNILALDSSSAAQPGDMPTSPEGFLPEQFDGELRLQNFDPAREHLQDVIRSTRAAMERLNPKKSN